MAALPASTVRVPPAILRRVVAAVKVLNARGHDGPRPFVPADLIREAIAEGVPAVLARHGVAGVEAGQDPPPVDPPRVVELDPPAPVERKQRDWPSRVKAREARAAKAAAREDGVSKALDFARPLLEAGKSRPVVCEALNAAGLLNTVKGNTPRPWHPEALARALGREGSGK